MGKIGSELNLKDKGSYDKQMLDGEKTRRKETPGKHSEVVGVVGVVCMLSWGDGTMGRKEHSSGGRLQRILNSLLMRLNFILRKGNR